MKRRRRKKKKKEREKKGKSEGKKLEQSVNHAIPATLQ